MEGALGEDDIAAREGSKVGGSGGAYFFRQAMVRKLNRVDTKQRMAAVPAWHGELVCATAEDHAEVVRRLQHFLDSGAAELNIGHQNIEELPASYFTLAAVRARLVKFWCSYNHLTTLPAELGQLKALVYFYCHDNRLTTLPAELGQLAALVRFYCHNNNLTTLPVELGQLAALEHFDCSDNALTSLPAELGQLAALEAFSCSNNHLTELPAELGQLSALEGFWCSDNRLMTLPAELGRCGALKSLDCQNNENLGEFWAELAANGEAAYKDMSPRDLAEAWKARS